MKALKKYLITLLVGFLSVGAILWTKDIFAQTIPSDIFRILSDAFFATGVFITCAGLLVFSSNEGTFDMIAYGATVFSDFFRKKSEKKYDTFYDYRQSRADQKVQFGFLLICGLFFLIIAFVMYYFYCQYI